jgi:Zn-finger nucleic acid-binding protein
METVLAGRRDPVEVDRCDEHGIWLDRGELGRMIGQLTKHADGDEALIMRFLGETFRQGGSTQDADPPQT